MADANIKQGLQSIKVAALAMYQRKVMIEI